MRSVAEPERRPQRQSFLGDSRQQRLPQHGARHRLTQEDVETRLADRGFGNGGSRDGHVFNLGHGMSPDMDPEHVAVLVDEVHRYSAR